MFLSKEKLEVFRSRLMRVLSAGDHPATIFATDYDTARVEVTDVLDTAFAAVEPGPPVPMILFCPAHGCGERHIDEGEWSTRVHTTHSCQSCGFTWRPAVVPTVGVLFLPGFKNAVGVGK